jgi:hypothetical protein
VFCCRDVTHLLFEFVTGDLPCELRSPLEEHLGACASCLAFAESYRMVIELVQKLPDATLPRPLTHRLLTTVQSSHCVQSNSGTADLPRTEHAD